MTMTIYSRFTFCLAAWRRHSEVARIQAARRRIGRKLRTAFETLCDIKCEALKQTGVFATEHRNLESALLSLARALDDYNEMQVTARIMTLESPSVS